MASKYDGAMIEVTNWEKYNARSKGKRYSWFKLENNLDQGDALFGLNCEHKWLWIVILCQYSKRKCEPFAWNCAFIESITGLSQQTQENALAVFNKNNMLTLKLAHTRRVRARACPEVLLEERRGEEIRGEEITCSNSSSELDLESAYRRYPRKDGKSKGLKKLKSEIRSQEDFEKLILAIEKYAASRRGQDPQYTKHFSTFVSEWRDWIDYKPDEHPPHPNHSSPAFRRMAGNQEALAIVLKSMEDAENGKAS